MESIFEKLLNRISFLNINTPQLLAEFASHIGWSLGYLFLTYCLFGDGYLVLSAYLWVFYSVVKELFEDGHLKRIIKRTESKEDFKDFITDLLSRIIGPLLFIMGRKWK